MGASTYIYPNKMSKEARIVFDNLKSKVSDADLMLDKINQQVNEIDTFVDSADDKIETILNTVVEELEVTQSDIDSILNMVGDL